MEWHHRSQVLHIPALIKIFDFDKDKHSSLAILDFNDEEKRFYKIKTKSVEHTWLLANARQYGFSVKLYSNLKC
jgi:hypothetical protein